MMTPAEAVLYGIWGCILIENLFEVYIKKRQIKVLKRTLDVPNELRGSISDETFCRARKYALDQEYYNIVESTIMDVVIAGLEIYFGFMPWLWQISKSAAVRLGLENGSEGKSEVLVSVLFVAINSLLTFGKGLPFVFYATFVLEEKHGFNKQTVGFFILDQLKGLIVRQVISVPITAAVVAIVEIGGESFFIWLWLFTVLVVLLLLTIYPIWIAPLFDKYRPLEDGALRSGIEALAHSLKFPLTKLYVVEGSARSAHSNAYFYGLWNSKRIVLYDTLMLNKGKPDDELDKLKEEDVGKGCTNEEVMAVIAHELGHWKLGHMTKNIFIMQLHLLFVFMVFAKCFQYEPFYEAIGFASGTRPIIIGMLLVLNNVMAPYNALVNFAMTVVSRRFEYQADEFAQRLGYASKLKSSLIKLSSDNLGFPVYDWLYSAFNHSHPTLLQRIKQLDDLEKRTQKMKAE